jgi:hypothetical protein
LETAKKKEQQVEKADLRAQAAKGPPTADGRLRDEGG